MGKNKKYYKNNNYKKNNYKEKKPEENKVTYDGLLHAEIISNTSEKNNEINKILIIKYIAISAVLFAIIIGSLLLFRQM